MEQGYNQSDEIEIDLKEVFLLLWSKAWLIILIGIICGSMGFALSSYVISPMFESTTKIYILNMQDSTTVTYSDLQLGTQLTTDYVELVQSRYVLEAVEDTLNLGIDYEDLLEKVTITTPDNTRILEITVEDESPFIAMETANCIREVASDHIKSVMAIEAVNVIDVANLPTEPVSPSILKWTAIGILLGMFIVVGIIMIQYLLDDTIKTADDIEKYLGLSTLALIPLKGKSQDSKKKINKRK
ncbi:MAG: Wzz/FepE/Etk N-terminal domain-containing protein [Eubacteriales bacterium]